MQGIVDVLGWRGLFAVRVNPFSEKFRVGKAVEETVNQFILYLYLFQKFIKVVIRPVEVDGVGLDGFRKGLPFVGNQS